MTNTFSNTTAALTLTTGYALDMAPGTERWVTDIKGWYSGAPMRRSKQEKTGRHGTFATRGLKDARIITVSGHHTAATRAAAAAFNDEINAFLADGLEGVLTVDDQDVGTRYAHVYLMTPDVEWRGGRDVWFHLDLEAPDARKFAPAVPVSTGVARPGGGLMFDLFATDIGGLDFGEAGDLGNVQVYNQGYAPADVTFRVQGPPDYTQAGNFTVTEVETGRVISWEGTILTGQELVLDGRMGTVVLEGTGNRSGGLTRAEWPEVPGRQTRTYQFEADGDLTLTVEAAPAWW